MASISSMKMIAGAAAWAALKRLRTFASDSPDIPDTTWRGSRRGDHDGVTKGVSRGSSLNISNSRGSASDSPDIPDTTWRATVGGHLGGQQGVIKGVIKGVRAGGQQGVLAEHLKLQRGCRCKVLNKPFRYNGSA
eukprot:13191-Prorocentrum_minimum.AAC.1